MPYCDGSAEPEVGDTVEVVQRVECSIGWMGLMAIDVGQQFRVIGYSVSKPSINSRQEQTSHVHPNRQRKIEIALATMPPSPDKYWPVEAFKLISRKASS